MPETIYVGTQERWWVLRHLNPQMAEVQLSQLNEQRARKGDEALVYFIPHQFAKEAVYKKEHDEAYNKSVKENNYLRSTLHYYLFIKATKTDINTLVSGDWNRALRLRLTMCRSKSGEPLWATAKDMDGLIALMTEHREMFNLEPSPEGFQIDDKVMLKTNVFKGYEFYVTKVRKKEQGASLTLELPIFNGRFIVKTESVDVAKQDLPMKLQELLSPDYVRRVDQALTGIACHRYGLRKSKDKVHLAESESEILHNLQFLGYMEFDDSDIHNHVKALLLLHAILRKDRHAIGHYTPVVQQMLSNPTEAVTEEDAFKMAVLYLATQNVSYRQAARQYEQKHKTLSEPLSQLMQAVKFIRFRNNSKKTTNKNSEEKVTKQIEETMSQIRGCDFRRLSPQGAQAVWGILALSPYNTSEEGRAFQVNLKDAALKSQEEVEKKLQGKISDGYKVKLESEKSAWERVIRHFSGLSETSSFEITQHSFHLAHSNLLHMIHPSAATLVAYYDMLVALYPDKKASDSASLYQEYLNILLSVYSKTQQFSTSWWQLKAVLERHYHTKRT